MTFRANSTEEAERMMEEMRKQFPDHALEALRTKCRLIEAGIEVTVTGRGVHAVVVIDPSADPRWSYHIVEYLPDAIHTALKEMAVAAGYEETDDDAG